MRSIWHSVVNLSQVPIDAVAIHVSLCATFAIPRLTGIWLNFGCLFINILNIHALLLTRSIQCPEVLAMRAQWRCSMARNVADLMWEMLQKAGVKRCYGIVGDALNPVIDALRRNGNVEFVHVRNEECGVFAAVAEAYFTGKPVAVCGTAGPGVTHLFNGLMDARKEGASIIAIAGDVESKLIDTAALEELNPYKFFDAAAL